MKRWTRSARDGFEFEFPAEVILPRQAMITRRMQTVSAMTVTLMNRSVWNDAAYKRVMDTFQTLLRETEGLPEIGENAETTQSGEASNSEGSVLVTDGGTMSAA
ncbi:hypothetical protein LINPERPRIM_LOCUS6895, partial [Linum perenne]